MPLGDTRGKIPMHERTDPMVTGTGGVGGKAGGYSPESAAADIREILGAGGGGPTSGFGPQQRAVERWARERGIWSPWERAAAGAKKGGVEHFVRPVPAVGRIEKITVPPCFGKVAGVNRLGLPGLRDATPLEYLDRWRLSNAVFKEDVRVIGAAEKTAGFPSFVIEQRWVDGAPPEDRVLVRALANQGFERIPGTWIFYREADELALFDARPANFAWSNGEAVPFDVIPVEVDRKMWGALERLRGEGGK